ncbi:MAG: methyl-viologen-reducing hydrogenase delta subunit [Clostridiales bacterium]|jgi:F420-non-reducing hydrogenase iron-sulfur subunit|nr:methyl-viologen-reducing hydrogenase delta subunit [Clostridiales bacterium]
MADKKFEPLIVGILCNWCSYAGADLAGTSRFKYPENIKIIRVMCSGRVDPLFVIKAFKEGADGVLVSGCHPGDCHYIDGNIKAMRRETLLSKLLEDLGIEKERFKLTWVSASEGEKFVEIVEEMTNTLRELGPLNLEGGEKIV